MVNDWQEMRLADCMDAIIDYRGKTPKKTEAGIPLITAKIIKNGRIEPVSEFIAEDDYDSWMRRGMPLPGDIVMTTEAPLGEIAQLDNRKIALAQRVITLRGKAGLLDNTFLKYLMQSNYVQHQLDGRGTGTTVKGIKQSELREVLLKFPSFSVQKQIANILGSLDEKIETNRQTNQTLEAMAQALFKSWFVDFDPVIDNALAAGHEIPEPLQARAEQRKALLAGDVSDDASSERVQPLPESIRQLFPNRFVMDAEMGWIPEGWKAGIFKDIASQVKANIKPEDINDSDIYVGLEHIGRKQIFLAENGSGADVESNKSGFKKDDLLFGKLRPYFHKVCLAPKDGICSTDILVFRAKQSCYHSFMVMKAYTESFVEYADLRSTGTRMPRASAKDMLAYQIVLPPEDLAVQFENIVRPWWRKGFASVVNSDEAAKLRDTLLPKLISGELRLPVPDAEEIHEQSQTAVV